MCARVRGVCEIMTDEIKSVSEDHLCLTHSESCDQRQERGRGEEERKRGGEERGMKTDDETMGNFD